MARIGFKFKAPVFAIGAAALSISAGVARLVPALVVASAILFVGGLVLLLAGVATLHPRDVIVHRNWDTSQITRAMRRAPSDAVVQILQTWFPEEAFVPALRNIFTQDQKNFALDIMLMDPATEQGLLGSRVQLRNMQPSDAAKDIRDTVQSLQLMKQQVEKSRQDNGSSSRRVLPVDLEIRLYTFMPFGPIYKIGEEVMYVGFFINYGTSNEAPMIEVRNTPENRLWALFSHNFNEGWSKATPC